MDDDRVLIEPRKIPGDPHIDHPVILNLFVPYLEFLRKEMKVKKSSLRHLRFPSMSYFTARVGGKKISVFGTPLGCPQAAIMLVLFGTDRAGGLNVAPAQAWAAFRRLPLTDDEFKRVAENLAPYFR